MKSIHYQNVLKRVTNRIWDTLSPHEQLVVADDVERETPIAKWFNAAVVAEAKAKYESPAFWMNEPYSFRYSDSYAPEGWPN